MPFLATEHRGLPYYISVPYAQVITVLDGIFCAGGDAKFDMQGNIGAMWCFSVPLGFLAAFWLKLPVMVVYCIVNLDEIVKLPAVYLHYKKYVWVRNITRDIEE